MKIRLPLFSFLLLPATLLAQAGAPDPSPAGQAAPAATAPAAPPATPAPAPAAPAPVTPSPAPAATPAPASPAPAPAAPASPAATPAPATAPAAPAATPAPGAPAPAPAAPASAAPATAAPATLSAPPPLAAEPAVVVVQKGDSLANIASKRYGSMYYSKLITVHNQIKNPNKVKIGDKFKTPGLTELMASTGVTAGAAQPVADLLLAIAHFRVAGPEFTAARTALATAPADPKTKKKPKWAVPETVSARLNETARLLESAAAALGALTPGEKVQAAPKTAATQITAAANQVKYLAAGGALDKNVQKTEVGTVDQLISGALGNLILWAQGGYK